MFSNIFEERDKKLTHLIKLGDCLGRSLRENVSLFSIDGENQEVTYITESNAIISGKYDIGKDVTLSEIEIQDTSIFENEESFDTLVSEKIHEFIEGIHYSELAQADNKFEDILSLWENRLKLSSVQKRLAEKTNKLQAIEQIIESDEIQNVIELLPQIQEFLEENYHRISEVPEIKNAVNLSNAVSKAFNFPHLTYDQLAEDGGYILKDGVSESIYEMICRQELVKKELLESKKNFETVWATNDNVKHLAGLMFESDEEIVRGLAEALKEVPYLAVASKKTLFETFSKCLGQTDGIGVSEKDIAEYASKIFEVKKEVKQMFIEGLNEKYGVNIQNLQDPASFKSLINTQVVIFESLSRLASKGSVLRQVLSEAAASLKGKSGVEAIDLNEIIFEIFHTTGYGDLIEEATAEKSPKINLKRVSQDIGKAQDIISNLKDQLADAQYSSDETTEDMPEEPKEPEQPKSEDQPTPEEAEANPEVPKTGDEKDAVEDLNSLETMVDDIAAELGLDDNKETEE